MPFLHLSGIGPAFKQLLHPTSAITVTVLPLLLLTLNKYTYIPRTVSKFNKEYDYIVIGAGSAGSVVASRLSEEKCASVLLLEAGGTPTIFSEVPVLARNLWYTDIDWQFKTVPQNHTGRLLKDRKVIWPSGKGIGGSTLINAMLYVRGNKKNYDDWANEFGAEGWSYNDVLPYFKKAEDNKNIDEMDKEFHGTGGPMTVAKSNYVPEFQGALFEGAKGLGYKFVDCNGATQTGMTNFQGNFRNGQRCSAAKAYLVPAAHRKNLHILPHAYVTKIEIQDKRAVGVHFDRKSKHQMVKARKEVILSAGTTNSAQILMLSGIGPKEHLDHHKIPVIADLPVGKNMQDHCSALLPFVLPRKISTIFGKVFSLSGMFNYIHHRKGPLSAPETISAMAFLNGDAPVTEPDFPLFQLYFGEMTAAFPIKTELGMTKEGFKKAYGPAKNKPLLVCVAQILQPKSIGSVQLQSANPHDPPLIDPNYFAEQSDVDAVVEALKTCEKLGLSEPMKKFGVTKLNTMYPGCEKDAQDKNKYYECMARSFVVTMSHQVGTAKMGKTDDPTTVVDNKLRVKGITGLRVVDASIMPKVISGNTNNPTMMIAEKASDMIKEEIKCT